MSNKLTYMAGVATMFISLGLAVPANAVETESAPLAAIQTVAPEVLESVADVSADLTGEVAIGSSTVQADVSVPVEPVDGVVIENARTETVTVGLPNADQADAAVVEAPGVVSYDNNDSSTTVPVVKEDGSVQITTVIDSADAPTRYSYPFEIPAGALATLDEGTGSLTITSADGSFLAGVAPAWAKDGTGADVPTHYELDGNTLTQVVEHGVGTTYPVVADPWLGIALIDRTTWSGNTLRVYPSSWARVNPWASAGIAARWAGWDEVVSKTPGNRENTPSMRDQFYCHFDFVRFRAPNKVSWNLDLGRPAYDYWTLIQRQCN